jgi:hypothetical protein
VVALVHGPLPNSDMSRFGRWPVHLSQVAQVVETVCWNNNKGRKRVYACVNRIVE